MATIKKGKKFHGIASVAVIMGSQGPEKTQASDIVFSPIKQSEIKYLIYEKLDTGETCETAWKDFWLRTMSNSLSCAEQGDPLAAMQDILEKEKRQIVFQVSGLENIFRDVENDPVQQAAIRALCQGVTNILRELPDNRIGLLVFIEKDLVKSAIKQNFGQFEALCKALPLAKLEEKKHGDV